MLSGVICRAPEVRYSPAGIPLTRFTLEHRSQQVEAGLEREAYCRIAVVVAGQALTEIVKPMTTGQKVEVSGFIARADNRQGQARIVLHGQQIRLLGSDETRTD